MVYTKKRGADEREREREVKRKRKIEDSAVEREYSSRDQYSRVLRSFILPRPSALSTHFPSLLFPLVHPFPLFSLSLTPLYLSLFFSLLLSLALSVYHLSSLSSLFACRDLHPLATLIVVVAVIWCPIVALNTNGAKGKELSKDRGREGNRKKRKRGYACT